MPIEQSIFNEHVKPII